MPSDISKQEALSHLHQLQQFLSSASSKVLQVLFDGHFSSPPQLYSAKEMAASLDTDGKMTDTSAKTRVNELRNALKLHYANRTYPLKFSVSEGRDYHLDIDRMEVDEEPVRFLLRHRSNRKSIFTSILFEETKDILLVTVGPDNLIIRMEGWLKAGRILAHTLRVLIWAPTSEDIAAAFALHLGENVDTFRKKQSTSWVDWKQFEARYPEMLSVRCYRSVPTMLGILCPTRLEVELLPFNDPGRHNCGIHDERPSILADQENTPISFQFFSNAFNDLWHNSSPDK